MRGPFKPIWFKVYILGTGKLCKFNDWHSLVSVCCEVCRKHQSLCHIILLEVILFSIYRLCIINLDFWSSDNAYWCWNQSRRLPPWSVSLSATFISVCINMIQSLRAKFYRWDSKEPIHKLSLLLLVISATRRSSLNSLQEQTYPLRYVIS
jgi:hypothetical protein